MNNLKKIGQYGRLLSLAALALLLVIGWSQMGDLAAAQTPDSSEGTRVTTSEPISPIATPEAADDSKSSQPGEQTIDGESDPSSVEVIVTEEPTDAPEATVEPDAPAEPEEIDFVIDPPSEDELGEPIKDKTAIARDDIQDEEGGAIDIFDLAFVAARYGTDDDAADINLDGTVDIFDLTILASNFGRSEPANGAAIITPTPVPEIAASGLDFGVFDLPVQAESFDAGTQYYVTSRPLRIGVGINYVKTYDASDSTSAPDPYALVAVGHVPVRTPTIYDRYQIWPYWRLGWWRYAYFPWSPSYSPSADYYSVPIDLEIRDDDGYVCYGYYGCRHYCQYVDVSQLRYRYTKRLTLYPSSCMAVDETGIRTYGYWLNSNQCRIHLQSWGTEWPRGYVSYHIDALWD